MAKCFACLALYRVSVLKGLSAVVAAVVGGVETIDLRLDWYVQGRVSNDFVGFKGADEIIISIFGRDVLSLTGICEKPSLHNQMLA